MQVQSSFPLTQSSLHSVALPEDGRIQGKATAQISVSQLFRANSMGWSLEKLIVAKLVKKSLAFSNPKTHYRVHKKQPVAAVVSQMNPFQTFPPYSDIVLPSTPRSPK
jgi:hypothetical protein